MMEAPSGVVPEEKHQNNSHFSTVQKTRGTKILSEEFFCSGGNKGKSSMNGKTKRDETLVNDQT